MHGITALHRSSPVAGRRTAARLATVATTIALLTAGAAAQSGGQTRQAPDDDVRPAPGGPSPSALKQDSARGVPLESSDLTLVGEVTYAGVEDAAGRPLELTMTVVAPQGRGNELRPGIVLLQATEGASVLGHDVRVMRRFAQGGYVVIAVEHRCPVTDGLDVAYQDVQRALAHVAEHASAFGVDASRIGLAASGASGTLAALVATGCEDDGSPGSVRRGSPTIRPACVAVAGAVLDGTLVTSSDDGAAGRATWATILAESCTEAGNAMNPVDLVGRGDADLLVVHGTLDTVVAFPQATSMRDRARQRGAEVRLTPLHGASQDLPIADVTDAVASFCDARLEGSAHAAALGDGGRFRTAPRGPGFSSSAGAGGSSLSR